MKKDNYLGLGDKGLAAVGTERNGMFNLNAV